MPQLRVVGCPAKAHETTVIGWYRSTIEAHIQKTVPQFTISRLQFVIDRVETGQ